MSSNTLALYTIVCYRLAITEKTGSNLEQAKSLGSNVGAASIEKTGRFSRSGLEARESQR
jgi:hypothetical protein